MRLNLKNSLTKGVSEALKKGFISIGDYNSFISQGLNVVSSKMNDGNGNKSCSIIITKS